MIVLTPELRTRQENKLLALFAGLKQSPKMSS